MQPLLRGEVAFTLSIGKAASTPASTYDEHRAFGLYLQDDAAGGVNRNPLHPFGRIDEIHGLAPEVIS